MKIRHKIGVLSALLLLAVPALADDTHHQNADNDPTQQQLVTMGGAMMGNALMGGGTNSGMMSMMMPMFQMMSPKHIEGRLAFLKTELNITDAQLQAWNNFANVMRSSVQDASHSMPGMGGSTMGQPDGGSIDLMAKMAAREKVLSQELDRVKKLEAAAQPLYSALSEEQKKTADELLMPALLGHM